MSMCEIAGKVDRQICKSVQHLKDLPPISILGSLPLAPAGGSAHRNHRIHSYDWLNDIKLQHVLNSPFTHEQQIMT